MQISKSLQVCTPLLIRHYARYLDQPVIPIIIASSDQHNDRWRTAYCALAVANLVLRVIAPCIDHVVWDYGFSSLCLDSALALDRALALVVLCPYQIPFHIHLSACGYRFL